MDDAKIYNVCLQRVKFQITKAKQRLNGSIPPGGRLLLESYNTGDIVDIVDILELYDLDEHSREGLAEKLDDLGYTVSVLVREKISFDYDDNGNLGLYFSISQDREEAFSETSLSLSAA